jgi:hypothetical protein
MKKPAIKLNVSETGRTIILLVLIALALGFILWMRHTTSANFEDMLR